MSEEKLAISSSNFAQVNAKKRCRSWTICDGRRVVCKMEAGHDNLHNSSYLLEDEWATGMHIGWGSFLVGAEK